MLRNPPSTTKTYINTSQYIDYPAVTFCFKNSKDQGYDLRILRVNQQSAAAMPAVL